MKTTFSVTVDTDMEMETQWWEIVMRGFIRDILTKEAGELERAEKRQKKKGRTNTDFSITVLAVDEAGPPEGGVIG